MINRYTLDLIRGNVERFVKQQRSTTDLMPFDPKRLLLMCDTLDALHEQIESLNSKVELMESEQGC